MKSVQLLLYKPQENTLEARHAWALLSQPRVTSLVLSQPRVTSLVQTCGHTRHAMAPPCTHRARDFQPNWMSSVAALDDDTYLGRRGMPASYWHCVCVCVRAVVPGCSPPLASPLARRRELVQSVHGAQKQRRGY